MLDGILSRGFASKCKPSLKATKNRIDVIRRKRNATQKFLKKDIADLLANGLDINAYGRADGLLVELSVSSCYDYVEQSCDFLLKHLLILQKLSPCPEDCREAVSSLMFAAARFSDLPELRDLRQTLLDKYGDSLEHFVNQEFLENLASKPASQERKIQLIWDIALEFKVKWDPRAFEKRMSGHPVNTEGQLKTYMSSLNVSNHKSKSSNGKEPELGGAKNDLYLNDTKKFATGGQRFQSVYNDDQPRTIVVNYPSKGESSDNGNMPQNGNVETCKFENSSLGKRREQKVEEMIILNGREIIVEDRIKPGFLGNKRPEVGSNHAGEPLKAFDKKPLHTNGNRGNVEYMNLSMKVHEDESKNWKPNYNNPIPPPYVKSSLRVKDYDLGTNRKSSSTGDENQCSSASSSKHIRSNGSSEKPHLETSHSNHEREGAKHYKDLRHGEKDMFYDSTLAKNSLPKPRSMRRKHYKSRSNYDENLEDRGDLKRKDEKQGLQLLIDEEKHQKDEEERIMDKLLIHYSKKPSKMDHTKVRTKPTTHLMGVPPPSDEIRENPDIEVDTICSSDTGSLPARSVSLPHEQIGPSEGKKVFARAATFQLDKSYEAKHVHPKLPDYDELAARFAAMKGR